jgi:hypothetical protein
VTATELNIKDPIAAMSVVMIFDWPNISNLPFHPCHFLVGGICRMLFKTCANRRKAGKSLIAIQARPGEWRNAPLALGKIRQPTGAASGTSRSGGV